jgi:tight adherence protein C
MLNETRAGSSRADAMRAIEQRTDVAEVRSFVLAILQADTFGVSIGRILRAQADEMRIKRRQIAQEKAMKAPVKMLLPMVFCIFPALFVIVLGPAVINIMHGFKK